MNNVDIPSELPNPLKVENDYWAKLSTNIKNFKNVKKISVKSEMLTKLFKPIRKLFEKTLDGLSSDNTRKSLKLQLL